MEKPDIALIYDNCFGDELGCIFSEGLDVEEVNVMTQRYGVYDEPFACAEWFFRFSYNCLHCQTIF